MRELLKSAEGSTYTVQSGHGHVRIFYWHTTINMNLVSNSKVAWHSVKEIPSWYGAVPGS